MAGIGNRSSPLTSPSRQLRGGWCSRHVCLWALRQGLGTSVQLLSSPTISFCAQGAPLGSFLKSLTLSNSGASRPISRWISAFSSSCCIWFTISLRCGNLLAISGVGILCLSRGMLFHSMRVGSSDSVPFRDFKITPVTRRPYFASFSPLHVVR